MDKDALIVWLATIVIVGSFCAYFFFRVLTAEKKPAPDSYSDNDQQS